MPPSGRGAADLCPVDRQTAGGCGGGSRVCERWRPDALGQPARAKWTPRALRGEVLADRQRSRRKGLRAIHRGVCARHASSRPVDQADELVSEVRRARRTSDTSSSADPSIKLMSSYPRSGVLAGAEGQLDYLCPHHYETGDLTEVVREFESLRERIRTRAP